MEKLFLLQKLFFSLPLSFFQIRYREDFLSPPPTSSEAYNPLLTTRPTVTATISQVEERRMGPLRLIRVVCVKFNQMQGTYLHHTSLKTQGHRNYVQIQLEPHCYKMAHGFS